MTRFGDLLDFGQVLKPLAATNWPKSPTFLGNFCKGVTNSFLGKFYSYLAIFFWSHCWWGGTSWNNLILILEEKGVRGGCKKRLLAKLGRPNFFETNSRRFWTTYVDKNSSFIFDETKRKSFLIISAQADDDDEIRT